MKKLFAIISSVLFVCLASATNSNASVGSDKSSIKQVTYGNYCCDTWGTRRCTLVAPSPVNAYCVCFGMSGAGLVCL
jgi:hypothetical protein